jgi:hypothetical protein
MTCVPKVSKSLSTDTWWADEIYAVCCEYSWCMAIRACVLANVADGQVVKGEQSGCLSEVSNILQSALKLTLAWMSDLSGAQI